MTAALVVAHQGGWDEFLYFAVPAVIAVFAIRWAEKRARQRRRNGARDKDSEARRSAGDGEPSP